MTAAYEDLHHLVDRLTPDQAAAVRAVVLQLVVTPPADSIAVQAADEAGDEGGHPVRRLSFAGLLHSGTGDLAARSEDILRDEFGRHRA
jgi:hypothetical protein